jgi:hypothetical protein
VSARWHTDPEKQVTILLGWESVKSNWVTGEPLGGGYFAVVWETGSRDAAESSDHAFSNLDQESAYTETLEPYTELLSERWGVTLPAELIGALEEDKRLNR